MDEWYNYQGIVNPVVNGGGTDYSPRNSGVHVLLTLDESTYAEADGSDGVNDDHPISWCHTFDGGRAWYTGMGHTEESFLEANVPQSHPRRPRGGHRRGHRQGVRRDVAQRAGRRQRHGGRHAVAVGGAVRQLRRVHAGRGEDYVTSLAANVLSTGGDATLSVADPSATATGRLVNGAFALPQALQLNATGGGTGGAFAPLSGAGTPLTLQTYGGPISNDAVTIGVKQSIGATDALRTGIYSKTLVFTLSTTSAVGTRSPGGRLRGGRRAVELEPDAASARRSRRPSGRPARRRGRGPSPTGAPGRATEPTARSRRPGRGPRRAASASATLDHQPDRVAGVEVGVADGVGDELRDRAAARRASARPGSASPSSSSAWRASAAASGLTGELALDPHRDVLRIVDEVQPLAHARDLEHPVHGLGALDQREPAARLARPHVGEHDQAQAARVHELEPAHVEHDGAELGLGGEAVELVLEQGGAREVELAGGRDDGDGPVPRGFEVELGHRRAEA